MACGLEYAAVIERFRNLARRPPEEREITAVILSVTARR